MIISFCRFSKNKFNPRFLVKKLLSFVVIVALTGIMILFIKIIAQHSDDEDKKIIAAQLAEAANDPSNPANISPEIRGLKILDYTERVYYFPYVGADFGNCLAGFVKNHPDIEVVTAIPHAIHKSSAVGGDWDSIVGYFVVCRPKENK